MDLFHALVFGAVEGVTEFLPISSTGHLILLGIAFKLPETDFLKSFEIAIQLGAILAVLVLYGKRLLKNREILARVAVAFLPTGAIGFVLYKVIKKFLLGNVAVVLWALLLGGLALIIFERLLRRQGGSAAPVAFITYRQAFLIGVGQSLSVIPGVSRAAATIVSGLALGLSRETVVEFSFLLAIPTMAAATGYDLLKSAASFSSADIGALALGFAAAFVTALFAIRFLLRFIKTHSFVPFGIYRIILAAAFWLFVVKA